MARTYPSHLRVDGRGYLQCARSGQLRKPKDMIRNHDGQMIAREFADITPGFGTLHPQDRNQAYTGGDPTTVENATGVTEELTKEDMSISDAEIEASIRENRAPRQGY